MPKKTGWVEIRCYEELNDFLPPQARKRSFPARFSQGDTVKALVEALGIPHTEVDLVLVNGASVGFSHRLHDGDFISVYPVFESLDISALTRVRPGGLRRTRFVLDVHLGRLAKLLRMLGFDALYSNDLDDGSLSRISASEHRILLTRDRELLKRSAVSHGYCVRSTQALEQMREVIGRFDLAGKIKPFSRCLRCNAPLRRLARREAARNVPPYVAASYRGFRACPRCARVYWRGTHWERMRRLISPARRK
jgi:uncharacterized protein with PIN domain/sulfur carrier protein ThiS